MEGESERKKKSGEAEEEEEKEGASTKKKQQRRERGLLSRIWKGIFRPRGDDFEKRLQHISKEEAAVLSRIKRRSLTWRRMVRHLLLFSAIFEIIAVGYAIMTTRSLDVVNWKARALRVLPMFVLPALSFASYSALVRFTRMCDRKDRKTLERLQAERQAKIDELKERTNYYITQQLIQRYDPDPAAKAAAATVLASKLGADSGLKVFVGDESQSVASTGKSNDVELVQSSGLRNRKDVHTRSSSEPSPMSRQYGVETPHSTTEDDQLVVDHYHPEGPAMHNGGWMARLAALLVGEDPTQSYALICGNCHMHNGLARKEDFPYIKYYCPHCRALNQSKQSGEHVSGSASPEMSTLRMTSGVDMIESPAGSVSNSVVTNGSPVAADTVEAPEKTEMKNIAAKE